MKVRLLIFITQLSFNHTQTSLFFHFTIHNLCLISFFFFNDTATTEIYTLSLHDALPICAAARRRFFFASGVAAWSRRFFPDAVRGKFPERQASRSSRRCAKWKPAARRTRNVRRGRRRNRDRKSTRLNSSH